MRDTAKKQATGRILYFMVPKPTRFSRTPGSMSGIVLAMIRVNMVASTMCHVHKNIGKGKWNQSNTNLLKSIMTADTEIQIMIYTHDGAIFDQLMTRKVQKADRMAQTTRISAGAQYTTTLTKNITTNTQQKMKRVRLPPIKKPHRDVDLSTV